MQRFKITLLLFTLLLVSELAYAQNGLNGTYTCVVMQEKKYIGGIGIKVGAPMALTYKMYFLKRFAFEIAGGLSNTSVSEDYVKDKFGEITEIEMGGNEIPSIEYFEHTKEGIYAAQARLMMHNPIPKILSGRGYENLDWYIGLGAEIRVIDIKYLYRYTPDPYVEKTDIASFRHKLVEYGPEWMFGFEYAFKDIPLAAFAEMGMFFRINEDVPFHAVQGGLGARFNF